MAITEAGENCTVGAASGSVAGTTAAREVRLEALTKLPRQDLATIEASDGFHMVAALERWPAGALPLEVRGPALERQLFEQQAALLRV